MISTLAGVPAAQWLGVQVNNHIFNITSITSYCWNINIQNEVCNWTNNLGCNHSKNFTKAAVLHTYYKNKYSNSQKPHVVTKGIPYGLRHIHYSLCTFGIRTRIRRVLGREVLQRVKAKCHHNLLQTMALVSFALIQITTNASSQQYYLIDGKKVRPIWERDLKQEE